jgi:hypothetical protein
MKTFKSGVMKVIADDTTRGMAKRAAADIDASAKDFLASNIAGMAGY